VLGPRRAADVSQLLAAAKGWPAVIGLAALTSRPTDLEFHESLYDYFADELLNAVPRTLRRELLTLALLPSLTPSALRFVAGSQIVPLALDLGFVSVDHAHSYVFHPLLRDFLVRRCSHEQPDELNTALEAVGDYLIQNSMWDDALALLETFPFAGHCLVNLISRGSDDLFRDGRVSTVGRLVAMARERGLASQALDLAEAEVAFRKGEHAYACCPRG
jgi:ATP/maltotriose-dependent transcriptional regulator MalT